MTRILRDLFWIPWTRRRRLVTACVAAALATVAVTGSGPVRRFATVATAADSAAAPAADPAAADSAVEPAAEPAADRAAERADRPAPCESTFPPTPPPLTPTTLDTVAQAYYCVLDHYVAGGTLDDRTLLVGAFTGFTQELHRRGLDRAAATLPVLTGDRDGDWTAFGQVYQQVADGLSADAAQALAEATLTGMLASLHDNHARWLRPVFPPNVATGQTYGLGIDTSPGGGVSVDAPGEAVPPVFLTEVLGGPAAAHGLRPGDIVVSVNGSEPFAGGEPAPGVFHWLYQQYPQQDTVRITVHRPSTGRTWTVTMRPEVYTPTAAATQTVASRLLPDHTGYVKLREFGPGAANQVVAAIEALRGREALRGVVLDLRGNRGGDPTEVSRLLGAFVHGRAWSYDCDEHYQGCTPNDTDDSVALLHLPVVVLTDRNCASACDAFSGAVRDLHVGPVVGTRTSGFVSGPAAGYLLGDGSELGLPARHELGANREIINGIGVAPDRYVPLTAGDVSAGRDPALDTAVTLLGG